MTRHFSLRSQNSEYPRIFQVTGANQNARKLLSTDLVNTKYLYISESIIYRHINGLLNSQLGLIAQLVVEQCTSITEVRVGVLLRPEFYRPFSLLYLSSAHKYEDHTLKIHYMLNELFPFYPAVSGLFLFLLQ